MFVRQKRIRFNALNYLLKPVDLSELVSGLIATLSNGYEIFYSNQLNIVK